LTALTPDQIHMADFWDDNAFKLNVIGHAHVRYQKVFACRALDEYCGLWLKNKANADFGTTVAAYTKASIALFDAFINCWYVKYKSNSVRPETVINKLYRPRLEAAYPNAALP
jgi:hypothetical protein